ncbi:MAG: RNA polymerase sigma factor [Ruminococcaceae bacterium]|nr:RNA polymerase sigma factor [Oscillospiraceae bacterium]
MTVSKDNFEELFSYLYETAMHKYGDCPEIDTIVQDSMLAYLENRKKGVNTEHPKGYLSAVLQRKYNDYLRSKYKNSVVTYGIPETLTVNETPEDPSDEYEAVRREIGRLVKIYREVTVRHYVHGHSVDKIAKDLGIPRGTVLSRLSKAREQVKEGLNMEKYAGISYEPKHVGIGIWGSSGLGGEPFTLLHSQIEGNILILAYENPISLRGIADTMGMPCAYVEPLVDKLVKGELLGKTASGLVYTRAFMRHYENAFGNINAQEELADKYAVNVWNTVWKHTETLTSSPSFLSMSEKQKATLFLFVLNQAISEVIRKVKSSFLSNDHSKIEPPERPNAGRWLATLTIMDEQTKSRSSKYDGSGPVQVGYQDEEGKQNCVMYDCQSVFGDAHWAYNRFKYQFSLLSILRFYASLLPSGIKTDNPFLHELVPEFEKLHILNRDENGNIRLDIPALTYNESHYWNTAIKEIQNELFSLLKEELSAIVRYSVNRVPKHVDGREHYFYEGALSAYTMAQMLSIVEKGLMPYPVKVGQTPIIFLVYKPQEV